MCVLQATFWVCFNVCQGGLLRVLLLLLWQPESQTNNCFRGKFPSSTAAAAAVQVAGGLLSMGDAHVAQGDSEFDGTGIETSITGRFKITLHKKGKLPKTLRVSASSRCSTCGCSSDWLSRYDWCSRPFMTRLPATVHAW